MKSYRKLTLKRKIILTVCAALCCAALAAGVALPALNPASNNFPDKVMSAVDGEVSKSAYTAISVSLSGTFDDGYDAETIKDLLTVTGTLDGVAAEEIDGSLYEVKLNGEANCLFPSNLSNNVVTVVYTNPDGGQLTAEVGSGFTVTAAKITGVELRVDENYTKVGDYYMNGDYYAFVQGMSQADVFSHIDIVVKFANGERTVKLGTDNSTGISVTSSSANFGSSSSTTLKEDYKVEVSVSRGGTAVTAVTASEEYAFRRLEVVGLQLKDWTQPNGLNSSSLVSALGFRGHVYPIFNTGESNDDTDNFEVDGSLAPTGKDIAAALNNPEYTYSKKITIKYKGAASDDLKDLTVEINDIKYSAPLYTVPVIGGSLPAQTVLEDFELGENLYIQFGYMGGMENLYLHEFDDALLENLSVKYVYKDETKADGKTNKIRKSIKEIQINFEFAYGGAQPYSGSASFSGDGLQINQIDKAQPELDNFVLTYSDTDCSASLTGIDSTEENPVEIAVPDGVTAEGTDGGYKLSFSKVGEFQITLTLTKGDDGDYQWARSAYGQTNPARTTYVLTYTVQVGKSDVSLTLSYDNSADRAYGDGEPDRTVTASLSNGKNYDIYLGTPQGENSTAEIVYRLYYYGEGWAGHNNANSATTQAPKEVGTYYVYAVSGENAYCKESGRSNTVTFKITPKILTPTTQDEITGLQKTVTYDRQPHSIADFVEVKGLAAGDNVADVVEVVGGFTPITHVDESKTVQLSIKNGNKNYIWIGYKTTTDFECAIVARELKFSVSLGVDSYAYGDSVDLSPVITKTDAQNFYAEINSEPNYYKAGADGNKTGSALTNVVLSELDADKYVIEFTTKLADGDRAGDYTLPAACANFTVNRKKLTKIEITPEKLNHSYDGSSVNVNLDNWVNSYINGNENGYEDIFKVEIEGKRHESETAFTANISRTDGVISLTEAGNYTITVSFKNANYEWNVADESALRADVTTTYEIKQQTLSIKIDSASEPYNGSAYTPKLVTDGAPKPDGVSVTFTYEYYAAGEKVDEFIAAGIYTVSVTDFTCTGSDKANYVLPDNKDFTFTIQNSALKNPVNKSDDKIYDGNIVGFDEIIDAWSGFDGKIVITVTANGVKTTIKNVVYSGNALTHYVLSIVPADNYKWESFDVSEKEVKELHFTVNPLAVTVSWADTVQSYGGSALYPTANVDNKKGSDEVTVVVGFKHNNIEVSEAVNAGEYRVYVKDLDGADKGNYKIAGTFEDSFTIEKQEVEKPADTFTGEFNGQAQEFTFANWTIGSLVSAGVNGTLDKGWFDGAENITVSGESFDEASGTLTVTNAGVYSVTFTLTDSANYCWKGDGKTKNFTYSGKYACTVDNAAQIARKELTAPALKHDGFPDGELNIQWTGSDIEFPAVAVNEELIATDKGSTPNARGVYFLTLSIKNVNDKYNYVWNNKGATKGYLDGHFDFEPEYTKADGARIYLYYAVTGQVLDIKYQNIKNYTFGDNGKDGAVTYNTFFEPTGEVPAEASMKTPDIKITYSDGSEVTDLEDRLPWNAGSYKVTIEIQFDNSDYEKLSFTYNFEVLQKVIDANDLVWNWDDNRSYVYSAQSITPTADLKDTAIPKRANGSSSSPTIYTETEGTAINAGNDYYVIVTGVKDGNYDIADGIRENFKITPYVINVNGVDKTFVYGETITVDDSFRDIQNSFFAGAEGVVTVKLHKAGTEISAKPDVGGYTILPVWADENAQYAKNYNLNVTQNGTLTITERKITVTLKEASSVYGEAVNLYRDEVYKATFTDNVNVTGNPLVDDAKDVFTLSLIDCDATVGKYGISATRNSNNYDIRFVNEVQYQITPATITGVSAEGYNHEYDGKEHEWFTALNRTLVNESGNERSVKWYYRATTENGTFDENSTDWTEYNGDTVTNAEVKYYFLKVTADNHNPAYVKTPVKVEVTKAVIYVQVNLTIKYGENDPAKYDDTNAYKATIADLITGGMYTVSGLKNSESISGIGLGGTFTYSTDYTNGNSVSTYTITFDGTNLTATNYTFENKAGTLTVKEFEFSVNIDDKSSKYYADLAELTYSIVEDSLPASTYDGAKLTIPDAETNIFSLKTDANKSAPATYEISGERTNNNYKVTFAGTNGTTGKYTVTNATITVIEATGYNAAYDENEHPAMTLTATAVDGSTVTVYFYKALIDEITPADEINWNGNNVSTTVPKEFDVCNYKLYYRITAENHDDVYGFVEVEITKAENTIEADGSISKDSWTYGEAHGDVTAPEAKFKKDEKATVQLYYSATENGEKAALDGNYATVDDLFKAHKQLDAGYYQLVFTFAATDNYGTGDGYESDLIDGRITFRIEKAVLTVTAGNKNLTYGDGVPVYTFGYKGFVYGQNESVFGGNLPEFTSTYAPGYENGSVKDGGYAITPVKNENTLNGYLTNYTVTLVNGTLTVAQRVVTISIADQKNYYNLQTRNEDGTPGYENAADWKTGYSVVDGSFYVDVNGVKDNVISLKTLALTGEGDIKTNNAGTYPIYAVFNDDWAKNYKIEFSGCSYSGNLADDAIKQDGVLCAGTYTIAQASLYVKVEGLKQKDSQGKYVDATNVYNGQNKYYIVIKDQYNDHIDFKVTYEKLDKDGKVLESGLDFVVDAGQYKYIVSTEKNNNYEPYYGTQSTFTISPANLSIINGIIGEKDTIVNATIQYGTKIPQGYGKIEENVGDKQSVRFSGFEFTVIASDDIKQYGENYLKDLLTKNFGKAYTEPAYTVMDYDPASTAAGTECSYRVNISSCPNFEINSNLAGTLKVEKRDIVVTVKGNSNSKGEYTGKDQQSTLNTLFVNGRSSFLEVPDKAFGAAPVLLENLGVELILQQNTIDVGIYGITARQDTAKHYNFDVQFAYSTENKPEYEVTKKELIITVTNGVSDEFDVIYGDQVPAFEAKFAGFVERDHSYEALANRNDGSVSGELVATTQYKPYESHSGSQWTVTYDNGGPTLEFKNYKITYKDATMTVVARKITATTQSQFYEEDDGNYHGGKYGKSHEAEIAFAGVGTTDTQYQPKFTLSYDTQPKEGQTAGKAPTYVGNYKVTVTLGTVSEGSEYRDYIFERSASFELEFSVLQKEIAEFKWTSQSLALDDNHGLDTLNNSIPGFIGDIMNVDWFQRAYGETTDIYSASDYTVSADGLKFKAPGVGEYAITLSLNEYAQHNYKWWSGDGVVTLTFYVTSDSVTITVEIDNWTYKEEAKQPVITASNGNTANVRVDYAYVAGGSDKVGQAVGSDWINAHTLKFGALPVNPDAGVYVVRASYPFDGTASANDAYFVFEIYKAKINAPVLGEHGGTYTGQTLSAYINYDKTILTASYGSLTMASDGAFTALHKGEYVITFEISSQNYEWDSADADKITDGKAVVTWVVATAKDNVITWTLNEEEKTVVYGGTAFVPKSYAKYGTVSYLYASQSDPESWSATVPYKAGSYFVKAVCVSNSYGDYNGCDSVTEFVIDKAELTATAYASAIYGEAFEKDGNDNYGYRLSGFVYRQDDERVVTAGVVSYVLHGAEEGEKLSAGGNYRISLATDDKGHVIGLSADNYYIVAAEGAFNVGKAAITVAIGAAQSSYSAPLYDLNDKTLSDKLLSVVYGELAYGESVSDLKVSLTTSATALSNAGGYTITCKEYANTDYNITFIAGSYTVTPLKISLDINAGGGTFDGVITASEVALITSPDETADMQRVREELDNAITFTYAGVQNNGTAYTSANVPVYSGNYVATAVIASGVAGNFAVDLPGVPFIVAKKVISTENISAASQVYTGEALKPEITDELFGKYYTAEIEEYVNADKYDIVLNVKKQYVYDVVWTNGMLANSIVFEITKADNAIIGELTITGWNYNQYDAQKNAPSAQVKYGDSTKTFEYSSTANREYSAIVPTEAGDYWVRVTVPEGDNYKAFVSEAVTFRISGTENTVSMDDITVVYGEQYTLAANTVYGGQVKFYFATDREAEEWNEAKPVAAGEYFIKAVSFGNGNYDSSVCYAKLNIDKAVLVATVNGYGTYGDDFNDGNFTITFAGFKYDDSNNAVRLGSYTPILVEETDRLTVGGHAVILKNNDGKVEGMTAANYTVMAREGTFTVGRRAITVEISNANSAYTSALYDLSDKASSDKLLKAVGELAYGETVADLNVVLETSATASSSVGGYTLRGAGYGNNNYDVTFREGVYTITPLPVYVNITAGGYTYGQTAAEAQYALEIVGSLAEDMVRAELEDSLSFIYSGRSNSGTYYSNLESAPEYAGVYVATLTGANGNYTLIGSTAQFTVERLTVYADEITAVSQVYTGEALKPVIADDKYSDYYVTDIEENFAKQVYVRAGKYNVALTLNDYDNVQWDNGGRIASVVFEITKAANSLTDEISIAGWTYNSYDAKINAPSASVKFGDGAKVFEYSASKDGVYSTGVPATGNAGTYWVRVSVPATDDYEAFVSGAVSFEVEKAVLNAPTLTVISEGEGKNDAFTGYDLLSSVVGFNSALMTMAYNGTSYVDGESVTLSAYGAGVYTVKFTIKNPENYVWSEDSTLDVNGNAMRNWTVARMKVAKPVENTSPNVVSGSILTYIPVGFDESIMNIEGNRAGYGGTFTATVTLKDTQNYEWEDGTVGEISFDWQVVGISTVFVAVVSVVSCLSSVAVVLAGAQFVMYRRKKRLDERAIDRRSEAEQRKAERTEEIK